METDDIVVGLDIGSGKVCTVIGELGEDDQIEIIGIGTSPSLGIRKGVILEGPFLSTTSYCSSIIRRLPIPEPIKTPTRNGSSFAMSRLESSTASMAAVTANWTNFSIRLNSFLWIKG